MAGHPPHEELSPSQAAARIGASTRSVQRWIASGRLPARRVGGRWRVASDALAAVAVGGPDATPRVGDRIGTLFVANRGEIAARIARTCAVLGIRAVVPRTEPGASGADDTAHDPLGPLDLLDLLDPEAVVAAALAAGADAVHPGYGFLAENATFAGHVLAAGMIWVGPPADAIRAMADKAAARILAASLGVPVLPGYDGPDQSDAALTTAAIGLGCPLLVKPSAGGGGKGMRVVRDLADLPAALGAARREAMAAFADDRLILERHLDGPRHVEVQVLFDGHGHGVHLGERDCSVQRRHQKVLEETPSPAVDAATRARMCAAALRLAGAVGYESAGTVEFLLEDTRDFYFLEMNTRLQVEHPVTELSTGRDLVADQLRIAAGEPLGFDQADVTRVGHAVEVRLYAEDADAGFLPATGRVLALRWPEGEGIRVDAGIAVGDELSGRFDPLLAKVIAWGPDRAAALGRLLGALDRTLVLGRTTNLRFLRWLVRQDWLREGDARVDTLEREWRPGSTGPTAIPEDAWRAAAAALADSARAGRAGGRQDPWAGGWRLNAASSFRLAAEGVERAVAMTDGPDPASVTLAIVGDTVHVDVGGRSVPIALAPPPDVDRASRAAAGHHLGGLSQVVAPMPGSVIAVHVASGATVEPGDPLLTLEAMKMEHVVTAPAGGRLAELRARMGQQVVRGHLLAVIEP